MPDKHADEHAVDIGVGRRRLSSLLHDGRIIREVPRPLGITRRVMIGRLVIAVTGSAVIDWRICVVVRLVTLAHDAEGRSHDNGLEVKEKLLLTNP
jgi:hypothetical protein